MMLVPLGDAHPADSYAQACSLRTIEVARQDRPGRRAIRPVEDVDYIVAGVRRRLLASRRHRARLRRAGTAAELRRVCAAGEPESILEECCGRQPFSLDA